MPNPFEDGNFAWFWYEWWLAGFAALFALAVTIHARVAIRSGPYSAQLHGLLALGFICTLPLSVERIGLNLGGQEDVMAVLSFLGGVVAAIYTVFRSGVVRFRRLSSDRQAAAAGAGTAATNQTGGSIATGNGLAKPANAFGTSFDGAASAVPAWLHIRSGPAAGQSVPLSSGVTRLGRDHSNDVVIEDPNVSRNHAEIVLKDGRYALRDTGSSGGTMFDGRSISGEEPLISGATIMLGNTELMFTASEPATEFGSAEVKVRATTVDAIRPGETILGVSDEQDRLSAWIAVTSGPSKGQICQLYTDRTTIGRDGSNHLVVSDPVVSRSHAVVIAHNEELILVDLGSSGGTKVNGRPVSGKPVKNGARLRVGDSEMELVAVASPAQAGSAGGSELTMLDTPASGGVVVVRSGPDAGRTYNLEDGDNLVGRDRDSAVELTDPSVSRRHAIIRSQANGFVVYDLASKTGTFVDGAKLSGTRLKPGDRIALGRTELSLMQPRAA
ncbi:MAG: FHA domain-containing protein [Chloroflexi bacterium]|nr:FHA domain-containing protein [Chloroflexota bacterium]